MQGDRQVAKAALAYAGQPSQFTGAVAKQASGRYRLRLVAFDTTSSNAGVVEIPLHLR